MKHNTSNTHRNTAKYLSLFAIVLLFGTTFAQNVKAQVYKAVAAGSNIKVTGTSNLHDWEMNAKTFTCDANLVFKGDALQDINSLNFILPVKNLKSKESLMDTRAYKALNEEKFDKMTFKLTEATVLPGKVVKVTGNLTISGVTNLVTIQSNYVVNADESITFKGTRKMKMSDFKIKAPSFMMGALKTGDALTIDIQLKLAK